METIIQDKIARNGVINSRDTNDLTQLQKSVEMLLLHAVSRADINVKKDFLDTTIKILRTPSESINDENETLLWSAYNELSKQVAPVTTESLILANELEQHGGIGCLLLRFLNSNKKKETGVEPPVDGEEKAFPKILRKRPSYRVLKSRSELKLIIYSMYLFLFLFMGFQVLALKYAEEVKTLNIFIEEYENIEKSINIYTSLCESKNTHQSKSDDETQSQDSDKEKNQPQAIIAQKNDLIEKIKTDFPDKNLDKQSRTNNSGWEQIKIFLKSKHNSINFKLKALTELILPFVIGLLGAVTFLVRTAMHKLNNSSYLPSHPARPAMRLILGGLLGCIPSMLTTSDQEHIFSIKISTIFLAFLMGYSVELSFSLIDKIIEKIKNSIKEEKTVDNLPAS